MQDYWAAVEKIADVSFWLALEVMSESYAQYLAAYLTTQMAI